MIEIRKTNYIPLWVFKIFLLILFLVVLFVNFEIQNELSHFQGSSLLKLREESIKDEINRNSGSGGFVSKSNSNLSEVDSQLEVIEVNSEAKLETGDVNEVKNKVFEYSINSVDDLIFPIVNICLRELTNIYDILELEYNSISSISMLDNLEECINTKNTIDKILKIMIKAKELLFHKKEDSFSDINSPKENLRNESENKRSKTSDLFFYLQTNISILKKAISLYNIKYRIFSSQEQILGRITMLMNEINILVVRFKNLTKNNKNTFEKVIFEITKSVSKINNEYKSILRKTNLFMSNKYHTNHSRIIEHYIQTVSCMLKYRLQSSPIFDELLFILKPTLKLCQ